jgi:hypothetical protein
MYNVLTASSMPFGEERKIETWKSLENPTSTTWTKMKKINTSQK